MSSFRRPPGPRWDSAQRLMATVTQYAHCKLISCRITRRCCMAQAPPCKGSFTMSKVRMHVKVALQRRSAKPASYLDNIFYQDNQPGTRAGAGVIGIKDLFTRV